MWKRGQGGQKLQRTSKSALKAKCFCKGFHSPLFFTKPHQSPPLSAFSASHSLTRQEMHMAFPNVCKLQQTSGKETSVLVQSPSSHPWSVPGQAGRGWEHPEIMEGSPASAGWHSMALGSLPTQTFRDSNSHCSWKHKVRNSPRSATWPPWLPATFWGGQSVLKHLLLSCSVQTSQATTTNFKQPYPKRTFCRALLLYQHHPSPTECRYPTAFPTDLCISLAHL